MVLHSSFISKKAEERFVTEAQWDEETYPFQSLVDYNPSISTVKSYTLSIRPHRENKTSSLHCISKISQTDC